MAKEKALIIRRHAHEELEISYEFYVKEYSLDYAEKFRKEFYDQVERIIPNYDGFPGMPLSRIQNKKVSKYCMG